MTRGRRLIVLAALSWGLLSLGIAVHAAFYPQAHTVYDVYSRAAHDWWAGRDMYVTEIEHYRYSPLFAIAVTPFAVLPDACGTPLWKLANIALYAFAIWRFARVVLPQRTTAAQIGALFLLVLPLSAHSMQIGQANLLMLGSCLLGVAACAEERWNQAAFWLAAATLTKGYPLALGLLLAGLYPRRLGCRLAAALALGLVLPFLTAPPSIVIAENVSWYGHLRDSTVIMRERLRSMDHLFEVFHQPLAPHTFALLGVISGGVVFGLCLFEAWRGAAVRPLLTRVFQLFAIWAMLFGPATESCTYIVVAPAIAWSLIGAFCSGGSRLARLQLIASLVMMGPLVTDLFPRVIRDFASTHGSQPLGALLYLGYLLGQTGRRAQVQSAAERLAQPSRLAA